MSFGLLLVFIGLFTFSPFLIMIGIFLIAVNSAANNSRTRNQQIYRNKYSNRKDAYDNRNNYYRTIHQKEAKQYNESELNRIYTVLNNFFSNHEVYAVTRQINLRSKHHINYLNKIDVYFENTYLCNLSQFSQTHPLEYEKIMNSLLDFANKQDGKNAVDATFKDVKNENEKVTQSNESLSKAEAFAKEVDNFNNLIPDYRISLKLDKTSGLLRQISTLEAKNNGSDLVSLQKLYSYYMPMLNEILTGFSQLQNATTHHDHDATVDKVSDVIDTINDSMQTIINEMNDEDFINLNASLNTLETLLKNDGLVTDSKLDLSKTKAKAQAESKDIQLTLEPEVQAAVQEEMDEQIKLDLDSKIGEINDTFKSDTKITKG